MSKPLPVRVSVSRAIAAPPGVLYDLVSDVTRMGEWSPETVSAEWLDGAHRATVGARFKGTNVIGRTTWTTKPTVTEAERGVVFAFQVPGASGGKWRYEFHPQGEGTTVVESVVQDKPSPFLIRLLQRRAGVTDRSEHLRQGMATTLSRLGAAACVPGGERTLVA
jgi:ribosome-associated toxin RatA of RatAB toxin-antitoxin module